jgi:hypothetical protein
LHCLRSAFAFVPTADRFRTGNTNKPPATASLIEAALGEKLIAFARM